MNLKYTIRGQKPRIQDEEGNEVFGLGNGFGQATIIVEAKTFSEPVDGDFKCFLGFRRGD